MAALPLPLPLCPAPSASSSRLTTADPCRRSGLFIYIYSVRLLSAARAIKSGKSAHVVHLCPFYPLPAPCQFPIRESPRIIGEQAPHHLSYGPKVFLLSQGPACPRCPQNQRPQQPRRRLGRNSRTRSSLCPLSYRIPPLQASLDRPWCAPQPKTFHSC